jgi:cell wall-associated NlpC family hydrolase
MPHTTHRRAFAFATLLAFTAGTVAAALATGASAAPIDDKRKEAAAIETQIEDTQAQLSALNEQIMGAQAKLDGANAAIADAEASIAAAKAETDRLAALVHERAASVYRSASSGRDNSVLGGDAQTLAARKKYSDAADAHDNDLLDQLSAAREDLALRRHDAEDARKVAENEKAALDGLKAQFEASKAELDAAHAKVQGEIGALVEQERQRRIAAQAPKNFDPGNLPPASGRGGIAIAYAQGQLGKPYCYAGTGPDCYDCSGLTLASWAQAGVSLPHNSESQHSNYPHVPMDQLAPGDIVWRPDHVGLYVGNGTAIHATHEGDVIRYIGVSYFEGASRPG